MTAPRRLIELKPCEWDQYREELIDLYRHQNKTTKQIDEYMRKKHHVKASERIYGYLFKQKWGISKNTKRSAPPININTGRSKIDKRRKRSGYQLGGQMPSREKEAQSQELKDPPSSGQDLTSGLPNTLNTIVVDDDQDAINPARECGSIPPIWLAWGDPMGSNRLSQGETSFAPLIGTAHIASAVLEEEENAAKPPAPNDSISPNLPNSALALVLPTPAVAENKSYRALFLNDELETWCNEYLASSLLCGGGGSTNRDLHSLEEKTNHYHMEAFCKILDDVSYTHYLLKTHRWWTWTWPALSLGYRYLKHILGRPHTWTIPQVLTFAYILTNSHLARDLKDSRRFFLLRDDTIHEITQMLGKQHPAAIILNRINVAGLSDVHVRCLFRHYFSTVERWRSAPYQYIEHAIAAMEALIESRENPYEFYDKEFRSLWSFVRDLWRTI